MFACLAAFAPQAADARLQEDHLVSAKRIWAGQYSDNVLEVIDWCLRLDPLERPQSVFALQKAIRDIPPKKRKLTVLGNLKRKLFTEMVRDVRPPKLLPPMLTAFASPQGGAQCPSGGRAGTDACASPSSRSRAKARARSIRTGSPTPTAATRCCSSSPTAWAARGR
jgi:hypothetical protein